MMSLSPPWLDGEKIPDGSIKSIFRTPPDVPTKVYRNALVVGSRGGGKTTYFRFLKHEHEERGGVALHFPLGALLGPITREVGLGVLTLDLPYHNQNNILGKCTSILAIGLAERLLKRGVELNSRIIRECIPYTIQIEEENLHIDMIKEIQRQVIRSPFEHFDDIYRTQPLPEFVSSLGEIIANNNSSLLLLLDRADMVNFNLLNPVLSILDQSGSYVALVATRPCAVGNLFSQTNIIAGDHYDIIHICTNPRSKIWEQFVQEAIVAQPQINQHFFEIPEDIRGHIIAISRESIRTALDLCYRFLISNGSENAFRKSVKDIKENLMSATVKTLEKYHSNFSGLINELRKAALEQDSIQGPVVLRILEKPRQNLFDETDGRLKKFIDEALRNDAFCPPSELRWEPGILLPEIEVAPLLVWNENDKYWNNSNAITKLVERKEGDVFNLAHGRLQRRTIFIAYRMKIEESKILRTELQTAINHHPNLGDIAVTDGKVIAGKDWAKEIRARIKKSKMMVADVTGMNSEVMFEIGFAYGLKKYIYPVVSGESDISRFPKWLSRLQVNSFTSSSGYHNIAIDINTILTDAESHKPPSPKRPVPKLIVWYRELYWNKQALEQSRYYCTRNSLRFEVLNNMEYDEEEISRATSAALLIVNMDGTEGDALMHFICGAIVASPNAAAAKRLGRKIMIIENPDAAGSNLVAESLKRCSDVVSIIKLSEVHKYLSDYVSNYNDWMNKLFIKK